MDAKAWRQQGWSQAEIPLMRAKGVGAAAQEAVEADGRVRRSLVDYPIGEGIATPSPTPDVPKWSPERTKACFMIISTNKR